MNGETLSANKEKEKRPINGWVMLAAVILVFLAGAGLFIGSIVLGVRGGGDQPVLAMLIPGALIWIMSFFLMPGFYTLEPNEARVLVLFGAYKGTVRTGGFQWGNPFFSNGPAKPAAGAAQAEAQASSTKKGQPQRAPRKFPRYKISLRVRTLNGEKLKVNDRRGNPVEIAAVVVWRVRDTAQAVFDVDDYENYVLTQSESALRHLASAYAYDHGDENEITLRGNVGEVSEALKVELEERLARAGVSVEEARLTHLAYAPEIAQAMLRRQQAEAIIDARQKIVHGATSMVGMALRELAENGVIELDDERKAAMVSNLMVVLCGETEVHPVVNTGSLYT